MQVNEWKLALLASFRRCNMAGNSNLHMSKAGKTDEFYTQLSTIEEELRHYTNRNCA